MNRSHDRGLGGFNRVMLVVRRRGRASEVVNLIDFVTEWLRDIMANQLKVWMTEQMRDVALPTREKIVEANDFIPLIEKALAKMRTEESSTASD
jgi:hypothetical protein